ncbi:MAG: methylated-DNA--[protein]-cysteine S-methyltransferase [Proteobacteria bacterium]|nr:methylated-DNA--[protein]-cysteine S-methyltransferase [Pseudomonadota bacterium]
MDAAFGPVFGAETEDGAVVAVGLARREHFRKKLDQLAAPGRLSWVDDPVTLVSGRQIAQYLAGKRRRFAVDRAESGTDFQRAVWRTCRSIPFGRTMTYGQVAGKMGRPRSARAVGGALNRNPMPIITPCHRVVGHDGSLTGFGGGLDIKESLLSFEAGGRPLIDPAGVPLPVARSDLWRATLADDCGNTGFIGFSPEGDQYHLVVPVDRQIAAGVKAKNRPTDGTPFGGYTGWGYFECAPYQPAPRDAEADAEARRAEVKITALVLIDWAKDQGFGVRVEDE